MSDAFLWTEKWRPKTVAECVLPDRIKTPFLEYVNQGEIPNLLLTGSAGVGKTTVAFAMCRELGVKPLYINSSEESGIDTLRSKIMTYASTVSLTDKKKVIILDEADYITPAAQAALRGTIEKYHSNCTFIFTCNYQSRLMDAIPSRCAVIDFTLKSDERPAMALAFLKRLETILKSESITYKKPVLIAIIQKFFPDYRRTLNELQKFSTNGDLNEDVLAQIEDIGGIDDLTKSLKGKDFAAMRKWVVSNSDIDTTKIFRRIYDGLSDYLKPESVPVAIIILADYQYKSAFAADKEINLVACLTQLMIDTEVKDG